MIHFAPLCSDSRQKLRKAIKNFSIAYPDRSLNEAFCYSVRTEKY